MAPRIAHCPFSAGVIRWFAVLSAFLVLGVVPAEGEDDPARIWVLPFEIDADFGAANGDAVIGRFMPVNTIKITERWKLVNIAMVHDCRRAGWTPRQAPVIRSRSPVRRSSGSGTSPTPWFCHRTTAVQVSVGRRPRGRCADRHRSRPGQRQVAGRPGLSAELGDRSVARRRPRGQSVVRSPAIRIAPKPISCWRVA